MKTLKFEGCSDDTFEEYGITGTSVDNCASCKPIQCLIRSGDESMLVVGMYNDAHHIGGCWVIGISMEDEGKGLPTWATRFTAGGYSPILEVDVPDDFALAWFDNGEEVQG